VELGSIRPDIDTLHMGTIRALYWRDWPRLLLVCRRVLDTPAMREAGTPAAFLSALQQPITRVFSSISLFAQRSSNVGRGSILTDRLLKPSDPQPGDDSALGQRRDGWTPSERPEQMDAAERALFLTRLVERRAQPIRASRGDHASQDALACVVAAIIKAGATPVLIVPPVTFHTHFDPRPETARQCIVLNFSDPSAYPELFTEETHFDADHLNVNGSRLFTEALAERFSAAVRQRGAR
jgi:hypothetical protein